MTESAAGLRPHRIVGCPLSAVLPTDDMAVATGVSLDSRRIRPGDLYVALPGRNTHGASFARAAVRAGAVAVLTDVDGGRLAADLGVTVVAVDDPRRVMARVAAEVYGRPTEKLAMYGVTGTTGKTSTTFLLEAGLVAAGQVVGTIGTIGFRVGGLPLEASPDDGDHARVPGPPGTPGHHARTRGHGRGHGGLLARPGAPPGGRHRVRRRGVHQPGPGPPRLPWRPGVVLPRQSRLVPGRPDPAGRDQLRRSLGTAAGVAGAGRRARAGAHHRAGSRGRLPGRRLAHRSGRPEPRPDGHPPGRGGVRCRHARGVQRA